MTDKEFERLKTFIKQYGKDEKLSHTWIMVHKEGYISPYANTVGHLFISKLIGKDTYMNVKYRDILKVSLWISTNYGTFYY